MRTFEAIEYRDYNYTGRIELCGATSLEVAVRHFHHKKKLTDPYAFIGPSGRTIIAHGRLWQVQPVAA